MERQRFEPTWPFLCVLAGLFVLSATSPQAWRRAVENPSIGAGLGLEAPSAAPAGEPDTLPDFLAEIVPLARASAEVTKAQWKSPAEPVLKETVEPIGRFETIHPAPKIASRVVDVPVPAAEPGSAVLPSRGVPNPESENQPAAGEWLPVPSLIGPMPMAAGASFDPLVLPVRRPDFAGDADGEIIVSDIWPEPQSLFAMLDELAWDCDTGPWARELARSVRSLGRAVSDRSPRSEAILAGMYDLGVEADRLAAGLSDRDMASRVLRAEHAFGRRLDIWRRVIVPGKPLSAAWKVVDPTSGRSINAAELLRRLDRYESTGLCADARPVAEICRILDGATGEDEQTLNQRLQTHYRNANLRIAVTGSLLNELVPEREPEKMRVRDTVLGRPVYGHSTNRSEVALRLIPDPDRLRMALEVEGQISSQTTTNAGPATFHSNSNSAYRAWREMELGTFGIRVWPTKVAVNNDMWLRAWETSLDGVPLVGALAHGMARNQHERQMPEADREVESKVASRVKRQFDEESLARLEKLSDVLDRRVFQPLERMSLEPVTVSAETTEERIVTRLRLATDDQLGSSTPRPEAPVDSLLSLQAHQSALNNVLEQLELDGDTFTLAQLRKHLADKLNRPEMAEKTGDEDDIEIAFAEHDAVNVQLVDGQVVLTLSVKSLGASSRRWFDFQVRVFFQPEVEGRTARLARDGVIQLIGSMNMRSQIALRGIFSKTFHKDRPLVITPEAFETDPRYAQTAITQLAIDDGWVGFALGPLRPESQVARAGGTVK
jgi:hypothetical protein